MIKSTNKLGVVVVMISYPPLPPEPAWLVVVHLAGGQVIVSQPLVELAGPAGSPGCVMAELLLCRLHNCAGLNLHMGCLVFIRYCSLLCLAVVCMVSLTL